MENFEHYAREEFRKFEENLKNYKPTVILLGQTGCGKSTLGNTIFGKNIFKTSNIASTTDGFDKFEGETINIIDSRGYELSDNSSEYIKMILTGINEFENNKKLNITTLYYCISIAKKRIEDIDILLLKAIANDKNLNKKLKIVYTKADEDSIDGVTAQKYNEILSKELGRIKTYNVSNDTELNKELDLNELIQDSINDIDSAEIKRAFILSQKDDLTSKKVEAQNIIALSTASAIAVGATPIPFSDSVLLVPIQANMIYQISRIFGLEKRINSVAQLSDLIVSTLGKSIAGNILKFIPGIGSIVGGAINGAVAGAITGLIGIGTLEYAYDCALKILNGNTINTDPEFLNNILKEKLKKENIKEYMKKSSGDING